ncbi:MAG: hypothetical protein JWN56_1280 [Sphingobacteriales bacterium]|nr:hypothetical protein [Sphingobacteriales bacterium]
MQPYRIITIVIFIVGAILSVPSNTVLAQHKSFLNKVDQYLQSKFRKSNIPGFAVAIVNHNKVIFSKGYGKTGDQQPITGNTPFAIASLSKAFTALAVLQLADSGKLNLDSDIGYYLPSFPLKTTKITVRQLLNQTSGLSDKVFPEMEFKIQPYDLEASIQRLSNVRLTNKPGDKFNYHNTNYQILAKLVEVISAEEFSNYLHKHVLMPLQMNHTFSYAHTKDFYAGKDLSEGHAFVLGYPLRIKELDWFVEGSAGMVSSVNDMAQWLMVNLNNGNYNGNQLLSRTGINAMRTPPDHRSSYGMGWITDRSGNLNHSGILWTYQSEQLLMTKQGYGIVILFNGGLNAFQDYNSFVRGISTILNNQTPESLVLPTIFYEALVCVSIIISLFYGIRRLNRLKAWHEKFCKVSIFRLYFKLLLRLFPITILLFIPYLFTALSGRVLSWERIFWTMPSIVIWLGTVSIMNLFIVLTRLKVLLCGKLKKENMSVTTSL